MASRRKAEELIRQGRVRVDGNVVTALGSKADPKRSRVELDGRRLEPEQLIYGIVHKPRGMVTTMSDPEGRATALDILREVGTRVMPVGRLDFNTSGALLFTNDGDFAQAMLHAKGKVPKVYSAKVQQTVNEEVLERWGQSIEIEGKPTKPAEVRILRREMDRTWLQITLYEGRNHQVRALGDHAGTPVVRLARLAHGEITTEGLPPGKWRLLTIDELKGLKKRYGVPDKIRSANQRRATQKRAAKSKLAVTPRPRRNGSSPRKGRKERDESREAAGAAAASAPGRSLRESASPSPRVRGSSRSPRTRR